MDATPAGKSQSFSEGDPPRELRVKLKTRVAKCLAPRVTYALEIQPLVLLTSSSLENTPGMCGQFWKIAKFNS